MDKIYNSLTKSAKYVLDDILNEYQDNLLGETYMASFHLESGEREISVKDIYYAKEIIEQSNKNVFLRMNKRMQVFCIFALGSGRNPDYNRSIRYYFAFSQKPRKLVGNKIRTEIISKVMMNEQENG